MNNGTKYAYAVEDTDTQETAQGEEAGKETTTALAPIFKMEDVRHHLMVSEERDYTKRAQEEFDLQHELGLQKQSEITAENTLMSDIDELTASRDYYEVDSKVLSKLFGMRSIKKKCEDNNIREIISVVYNRLKWQLFSAVLTTAVTVGFIEMWKYTAILQSMQSLGVYTLLGVILLGAVSLGGWIGITISLCEGMKFNFEFIKVQLKHEELAQTSVHIPFGAMLKTAEAKRTNIFSGFGLVRPETLSYKKNSGWESLDHYLLADPAIVGHTEDGRQFLIVYWDIEKDRARVLKNINLFKKRKLAKV